MSGPFIVYALPRSRTAWLSRFLTYRDWTCHHEVAITMRSVPEALAFLRQPRTGVAETGSVLGWPLLRYHLPEARIVVVRRSVDEVVAAMMAVDVAGVATYDEAKLRTNMIRGARALDALSMLPDVLTVDYADLEREGACAAVFRHCLPYPFPRTWWRVLRDQNIQADTKAVLQYYHANRPAVERFKSACMVELRRLARAGLIGHGAVT